MNRSWRRLLLGLSVAALLGACAAPPPQATVQVYTLAPQLPAGTTYRHERLPSQAARPDLPALEAVTDAWLSRAGLRRDDGAARFAVEVMVSQYPGSGGYGPYWGGPAVGVGIGGGSWGGFSGSSVGIGLSFPIGGGGYAGSYPSQRVDVLLRDLANGQVVFQSQATGNGGANPAMLLEAALRDFPNMPPGTRVVPLAGAVVGS